MSETPEQHQLDEMVNALQQVVNNEHIKTRKKVMSIVQAGIEAEKDSTKILMEVLDWCGNG
jgi:hypothetical protein